MKEVKEREIKFLAAKAKGLNDTEAAMEATGTTSRKTASVQAARMRKRPQVQTALQKQMEKQGITLKKALQPIADALTAVKLGYDKELGEYYTTPQADHAIRLKAADMSLKLMGMQKEAPPQPPMNGEALKEAIDKADEVELQRILFKNTP